MLNQSANTTFEKWEAGELSAEDALEQLSASLDSLEDRLEPLSHMKEELRNQIGLVVNHLGGKAEIRGWGRFEITAPARTTSYDARQLDALVAQLVEEGNVEMAQQITQCRKEGSRAGGLRITRAKA